MIGRRISRARPGVVPRPDELVAGPGGRIDAVTPRGVEFEAPSENILVLYLIIDRFSPAVLNEAVTRG